MKLPIRCYICTRELSSRERDDENLTDFLEDHGWYHLKCVPMREASHWREEPREPEEKSEEPEQLAL